MGWKYDCVYGEPILYVFEVTHVYWIEYSNECVEFERFIMNMVIIVKIQN